MKDHSDDCCCAYCVPEWPIGANSKEEARRILDFEKEQRQQDLDEQFAAAIGLV